MIKLPKSGPQLVSGAHRRVLRVPRGALAPNATLLAPWRIRRYTGLNDWSEQEVSEIGAYEAKTHLPRLLDAVEAGATITITRNGRAVARLTPIQDAKAAAERILSLRADISKGKLSMRALIEQRR